MQNLTEISRKSHRWVSNLHYLSEWGSTSISWGQNCTELPKKSAKTVILKEHHRPSPSGREISQNIFLTEFIESHIACKIESPGMMIPQECQDQNYAELPQDSFSSKCPKATDIPTECHCQNLTGLRHQAVKFHRTSSSQNFMRQKSHRRTCEGISTGMFSLLFIFLTITLFSHDDFSWHKVANKFLTFLRNRKSLKMHGPAWK